MITYADMRETLGWERCRECGECLVNCRYMHFSREEAINEIRHIKRGELEDSRAVRGCMSCYACNAFCPEEAHPYERIHYAWDERYRRTGLPWRASYLLPHQRPNFRHSLRYTAAERALQRQWDSPTAPGRVCLFPGCNLLAMPLLATGRLFEDLPVWGSWELCCGEMYFRMGLLDVVARVAERLTNFYQRNPVDELVFVCPAGYNMFTHVLPDQFGAIFDFRTTFITDWITERLERGSLEVGRPLQRSAVVHDSCHARVLGEAFMDSPRALLASLGVQAIETPRSRSHGLCCGVAAGCRSYSLVDLVACGLRELTTLDLTDAAEVVVYCTGCLHTLAIFRLMNPFGKPIVHLLEYVRYSLGEDAPGRHTKRALQMAAGILTHAATSYLSRKRFFVELDP